MWPPRIAVLCGAVFLGHCASNPAPHAGSSTGAPSASSAPNQSAAPTSTTPTPAAPPKIPEAPKPKPPYNVLLITIDALRADMPWAGYPRDIAPWLTKFAQRSTLYPRAYSLSSYTAKSVVPMLCGKYPSELKRDGYFFTRWYPENELVSERAQAKGVRTLAGHAHGYFMPPYGLNQGFDDYRLLKGTFLDNTGVQDINSDRLNALAKEMLSDPKNVDATGERPFFAYFHFLDPHYRYVKHKESPDFGNGRRDLYDNEVHFTDRHVGDLVDWAQAQPWGKNLVVIITADHGEGFGERGHYRHAYEVWESLVRVPLFIHVPGAKPRRIESPRSAIDLAPTIAELLSLSVDGYRGVSLVSEVFGAEAAARPVIVDLPRADLMDKRRAIIDGDYKLVVYGDNKGFQLFNVGDDYKETKELHVKERDEFARMRALDKKLWSELEVTPVVGGATLKGAPAGQRY